MINHSREEAERFSFVLEGIDIGIWFCDLPFANLHWDVRTKAHFGLPPDAEVRIETFYEHILPADREPTEQAIQAAIASRGVYDTVYRTKGPDRVLRWIRAIGRATYSEEGGAYRFDGVTLDVSALYRATLAERRSKARYRSLVKATSSIVWVCEPDGGCKAPQVSWEEYTGQRWPEYAAGRWIEAFHEECRDEVRGCLFLSEKAPRPKQGEGMLWHDTSGAYRHVEYRILPMTSEDGVLEEWVCAVTDIHDQRMAEQSLLRADKMKTEFLANMSHELRTPLSGVHGMIELLLDTPVSAKQLGYLTTLKECSDSLLTIVNDVLDLARIEAGKLSLSQRLFSIRPFLASIAALFEGQAGDRGLRLTLDISPALPEVIYGDPDRIRQILVNLVSNAVKFTHVGTVEIQVRRDDGEILFEVTDSGIGIKPDDLERLFRPFIQVHGANTGFYGGTGLGLSIARHLVGLMGGRTGARSQPGEGSTFWFRLELVEGDLPPESGLTTPAAEPLGLGSGRVLIVEDNPIIRNVVSSQLLKLGLEVVTVESGVHALEAALPGAFHLIFMDCQMPDLDGFETTRRLRRAGFQAPIIALTARVMDGDKEKCLAAGMDDYLRKPVSRLELIEKLQIWLGNQPLAGC